MRNVTLLSAVTLATLTPLAQAAALLPTKANGDFISGSGIPATNFTTTEITYAALDGSTQLQLALKGRLRNTGQANAQVGNVYYVSSGTVLDNDSNVVPAWSYDVQFSPGENGALADNLKLFIDIDFNPAFGATDFVTFGGTIPQPTYFSTIANPGSGAWSDDTTDFVVADSGHLGFAFWNTFFGKSFDPNVAGEYQFNLRVETAAGTPLGSTTMFVVVPEPTSLAVLGLGGLGLLKRKRISHIRSKF